MSEIHEIVKRQFDKQAENFSNWSVTKNIEYQRAYFDFCEISPEDTLLDLACGTGEYAIFAAPLVKNVHGVDISEGMIEIARKQAKEKGIKNASFLCQPVESTPFKDESFSIIICRSAFHHFHDYENIFEEMIRCCQKGGRISIQDIVSYGDAKADDFFEEFEREVDISHHKSLSKEYIRNLYDRKNIKTRKTFGVEVELNVHEYLGHAQQSEEARGRIIDLLEKGLSEPDISRYFINKDGVLFFKRNVYLILGEKLGS
jgi:ubiquinone/menaquinone biosynthesis C-methylase UbiE